jgi:hypothetical protein
VVCRVGSYSSKICGTNAYENAITEERLNIEATDSIGQPVFSSESRARAIIGGRSFVV